MRTNSKGLFTPQKTIVLLSLAVIFAGLSSLNVQSVEAPNVTHDGLQLDPDSKVALLYLNPDADFSVYKKFMMLDAYVAFKKNWERKTKVGGRRIPAKDIERIKVEAAKLLQDSFREELDKVGGYTFVDTPGDDVMILRPALIDLEITAPDVSSGTHVNQYVTHSGQATLFIELYDSVSGDILARAVDRRNMKNYGTARWANSVTNRQEAKRLFKGWASLLRQAMDEVRVESGLQPIKKG